VVDDAHWLDRSSAQTLAFVARRLLAERVALVFAAREPTPGTGGDPLVGLPELVVRGLRNDDARVLLGAAVPGRLDERVRDRIVAETHGNPLALLELPQGLSATEVAGGFGRPDARPVASKIEQEFMRRIDALPATTRRLLLVAAAEPVGDVSLVRRAADRLAVPADTAAAGAAGLIEFGTRVRFRHPLVRSAAYRAASRKERRDVHLALAVATDRDADPDRRAWHRAHAEIEPDEAVAGDLERSAARARARGGVAAAAAFLSRATELTADRARRGPRALAAAQATLDTGAVDEASEMLAIAETSVLDRLERAQLVLLKARIVFARTRGSEAPTLLLAAAAQLERLDVPLARETHLEALGAAIFAGRLSSGDGIVQAAEAAGAAPPGTSAHRSVDLLLEGVATRFTHGFAAAYPVLRRALAALQAESGRPEELIARWLWVSCPVVPEPVAIELWDDAVWHELAGRAVRMAREAGALGVLPVALSYRAGVHVQAGEFVAAAALIDEANAITQATGNPPLPYITMVLAAWQGDETRVLQLIETARHDATERGEGRAIGLAGHVTAVLHNGLGRFEEALAGARWACEHEDLGFFGASLVELVEAAARSGADEEAAATLARLSEMPPRAGPNGHSASWRARERC
jgi:hypothetical protein